MLISQPDSSTRRLMFLPPGPMSAPIFSGLMRIDFDARSVFAQFRARGGQRLGHFREDVHPGDAGFFNRFGHERERNALQLQVQLKAGDAFFRAGDLAVHVAVMIFPADDVGEELILGNFVAAVFGADADADAGDRTGHRNTRIQQRQRAAADGRHRGGTVGFHDLAGDANGVGIILGQHGFDAAFGQRAVADFATAGPAEIRPVSPTEKFGKL